MTPEALQRVQRADPEYTPDLEIVTGSTLAKVRALTPRGETLLESWSGGEESQIFWLPVDRTRSLLADAEAEGLTAVKH